MIGKTVSHYRILEKLGEGGMGVVYKAQDAKLDRTVALKFLAPELTREPVARERFIQEAKAASALDHPNICTIHEIDEAEGQTFLAMACVEGQTLRQRIGSGPLKLEDAVDIAVQIAQGLQEAHEKGIVHRDIKSSNIMVTPKGQVKIMDFGLAKLVGGPRVTKTGTAVGTVAYMSPEQARGESVDQRTDIWSLGVVLYEMVTGRLPFRGDYEQSVVYTILNEAPEPITSLRSDVPMELERMVGKALEKEPKRRYQRVEDLLVDLRNFQDRSPRHRPVPAMPLQAQIAGRPQAETGQAPDEPGRESVPGQALGLGQAGPPLIEPVASGPVPRGPSAVPYRSGFRKFLLPILVLLAVALAIAVGLRIQVGRQPAAIAEENSLAIMYFGNLAQPGDPDRLGEIVTELLITGLSESQYVQVVSSQRLYDTLKLLGREGEKVINRDVASQVAKKTNAKWMLTGSVLQEKPEIVLTSQLVEVEDGKVTASHRITGAPGETIFSLVDKLAAAVKGDLSLPAAAQKEERPALVDMTTQSQDAYRYFLEGWDALRKFYTADARVAFEKAVEVDSTFAFGYYMLSMTGEAAQRQSMITKAVKYSSHASHLQRFYIRAQEAELARDFPREIAEFKRLIERYPQEKAAYLLLGDAYGYQNQDDDAIRCYEKAIEIDPLYKEPYNMLAYSYNDIGNFEKSIWAINKYIAVAPDEANPYDTRADLYAWNGRLDEAIQSYSKALEVKPDYYTSLLKLAAMYIQKRDYGKAQSCCERLIAASDKDTRSWGRFGVGAMLGRQGKLRQALLILDDGLAADRMDRVESRPAAYKHFVKAVIYLGQKKSDLAVSEAEAGWQVTKKNRSDFPVDSRDFCVYILSMTGNISKAQEVAVGLRRDIGPNDQTSMQAYWRAVGAIELAKGNPSSAAAHLEKGVAGLAANYKPWRILLAQAYLESDRLGDAVGVLERQISVYAESWNPILARNAHYFLGLAYEKSGWREKAIQQYQQYLEILKDADPGIAEVEDARARLARLKGRA